MHFSFWEKAGFAALMAAWVIWGSNQIGDMLVHADELSENAYKIEVAESDAAAGASASNEPEQTAVELLASASPEKGEKVFKKCAGCHTADKGGAHKVGPNLWNVLGGKQAGASGYDYSGALAGLGGTWSYEEMGKFLKKPRDYAAGNKMTFAGLKKASDRAAVILYLRGQNDNPPPLP